VDLLGLRRIADQLEDVRPQDDVAGGDGEVLADRERCRVDRRR
jgi:hypothetical protein